MSEKQERPVLTGLIALVAVAAVVGLLLGGAALFGTRILGLGGDQDATGAATGGDSLYLPTPSPTAEGTGPLITLAPGDPTPTTSAPASSPTKKPKREIKLVAGQASVGSFDEIDLSGSYPLGEGSILQVQRLENGTWVGFYSVSVTVTNGSFSTFVQTSRTGVNKFRVVDSDTDTKSNAVSVKVG
ncbi:hypothetical protein [Nocardioides sp.]|uniref:hypothetical protein n=1 Tax=Nocardioides sp. TaxID=35761 RepID=UPI003D133CBE